MLSRPEERYNAIKRIPVRPRRENIWLNCVLAPKDELLLSTLSRLSSPFIFLGPLCQADSDPLLFAEIEKLAKADNKEQGDNDQKGPRVACTWDTGNIDAQQSG